MPSHVSLTPYWDEHTNTHLLKPDKPVLIVYAIGYGYTCVGRKLAFDGVFLTLSMNFGVDTNTAKCFQDPL